MGNYRFFFKLGTVLVVWRGKKGSGEKCTKFYRKDTSYKLKTTFSKLFQKHFDVLTHRPSTLANFYYANNK